MTTEHKPHLERHLASDTAIFLVNNPHEATVSDALKLARALLSLEEQLEALKLQADLDAERAAILSSAVGRARLILGDASKETTALIDAAVASYPAKEPSDAV